MAIEIYKPSPADTFLLQAAHADSMVYNYRSRRELIPNNYPDLKDAKIDTLLFHTWRVRGLRAALFEQLDQEAQHATKRKRTNKA